MLRDVSLLKSTLKTIRLKLCLLTALLRHAACTHRLQADRAACVVAGETWPHVHKLLPTVLSLLEKKIVSTT